MTKLTKTEYERYLNEIRKEPMQHTGNHKPIIHPGTYLRRNDPIEFNVGYNEWVREMQNKTGGNHGFDT